MTTKRGIVTLNNERTANTENPFLHVPNIAGDLHGFESTGGGGKEVVPVTPELRATLTQALVTTRAELASTMQAYPTLPAGMAFLLHEKGIAKSHRPLHLATQAGLNLAGHGKLNEMLVAADLDAMGELERLLHYGNTKAIKANISTITNVVPWTRHRRNPEGTLSLREAGRAVLRIFKYNSDELNHNAIAAVRRLLQRLDVRTRRPANEDDLHTVILPDLHRLGDDELDLILEHPAVRNIARVSTAVPIATGPAFTVPGALQHSLGVPAVGLPVVGVFDTGVAPGATAMQPWVASRVTYVLPPDTDHLHGTAVASLVAGGAGLNPGFENYPCRVHDVAGLEATGTAFDLLEDRVSEAVRARPDIKVWNLSLGSAAPCNEHEFSEFAQTLDRLTDRHGVLFVVAAGNFRTDPARTWPPATFDLHDVDRVSMPGESVRALTVGSIAHAATSNTLVEIEEPAPYSRRGPGPTHTPKPDVVHFGGNVHAPWTTGPASTQVLRPSGAVEPWFGTSFAAPLVSAVAGHVWGALERQTTLAPNPSLVKALLLHAAQLASPNYSAVERRYYGAGLPANALTALYDSDDSFTLVFEAQVQPGNWRWRKAPYPLPDNLMVDGKFRGEVIITAAYAPPLDANFGAEYVRANLEVSFGTLTDGAFEGAVPIISEKGAAGYEQALIEHGGKWSPVKTHRKRFPKGIAGETWALNATLSMRAQPPVLQEPQKAYIIVTLRSLDRDPQTHAQGIAAMRQLNWVHTALPVRVPIRT